MPARTLVYGEHRGFLVFLPEDVALAAARDLAAIASARTYGEARRLQTTHEWVPGIDEDDHPDDAPYDPLNTRAYEEGHWPALPAALAEDYLPADLTQEGEVGYSPSSHPTLSFDPTAEHEVIRRITARGYRVRRDDKLFHQLDPYAT